jgi:heme/copper-type cytochrome/quinol oxidase subunit 2
VENRERQRRLWFTILAVALADGLVVGGALFFVWWVATRGAGSGPAVPAPAETGGNVPVALIWMPLLVALLTPLMTLPVILLLRKRATGGPQTPEGTRATMVGQLIAALGGTHEAQPEDAEKSGQQNRTFILLVAAMGGVFLLAFVALYIFLLQARL